MDKLALMHGLDLPVQDSIYLLIGGISSRSLRGTASALKVDSVDEFLEEMHRIASATTDLDRKVSGGGKADKVKDVQCRGCGKKGHSASAEPAKSPAFCANKKGITSQTVRRRTRGK
ncbi:solute carrier family 12 member 8 [Lasius niger]|uniref:Solute carrier family 12 member 8 n=1 Tax=Lasius niger TaxID=67767 RepID=A0A0J7KH23_LASNI|nr:solute carrier family 12 member 8 [Lasius niger]